MEKQKEEEGEEGSSSLSDAEMDFVSEDNNEEDVSLVSSDITHTPQSVGLSVLGWTDRCKATDMSELTGFSEASSCVAAAAAPTPSPSPSRSSSPPAGPQSSPVKGGKGEDVLRHGHSRLSQSTEADGETEGNRAERAGKEKEMGNAAIGRQDYKEAIHHYTLAIAMTPDNPLLYTNRATAYFKSHQLEVRFIASFLSQPLCLSVAF
jgi:hypothetical protein